MRKMYNSYLFVPSVAKFLSKIESCKADAVIIDLEDSIKEADKDSALELLCEFLDNYSYNKDIFVRVNTSRINKEAEVLNSYPLVGYMLPKTETLGNINIFKSLIGDKKIIALVETAKGIVNIEAISSCETVDCIAFGAEDYTAQNNIKNEDMFLAYPKSKVVTYSKAYKKPVIDTISLIIEDTEKYKELVQISKNYGFDGKLAIHPVQVDIINQVFKEEKLEYYRYIVDKYDKSTNGVLNINGEIFEKPHVEMMRKKLKEYGR